MSSGPDSPHYEVLFGDGWLDLVPPPSEGNYLSLSTVGFNPSSRGELKLKSGDPWVQPAINPNLLGTELDVYTAVQGESLSFYVLVVYLGEGSDCDC